MATSTGAQDDATVTRRRREAERRYKGKEASKQIAKTARAVRHAATRARNLISMPSGRKRCPKCGVVQDYSDFHVCLHNPDGRQGKCRRCSAAYVAANADALNANATKWYSINKDEILSKRRVIRAANVEYHRERNAQYRRDNPEKSRASVKNAAAKKREEYAARIKTWGQANPERRTASAKKWREANPEKCRAQNGRYFASKINATPAWADAAKMLAFYNEAALLNRTHGRGAWHVDHIVPLRSKTVCGLNNHHNLQVIRGSANCKKSNMSWPGQFGMRI